jgi:hypothetical protein
MATTTEVVAAVDEGEVEEVLAGEVLRRGI